MAIYLPYLKVYIFLILVVGNVHIFCNKKLFMLDQESFVSIAVSFILVKLY